MVDFNLLIKDNTRSDDYVHANKWCEAYGVKWRDFSRLNGTRKYLKVLQANDCNGIDNTGKGRHTEAWIHPLLAIKLAEWLNPEFEMFVKQTFVRYLKADITLADEIIQRQTDSEKIAWIRERAEGKQARLEFTDELKAREVTGAGYASNTNAIYTGLFDKTANELKSELQVSSLRDGMSALQLMAVKFAEMGAVERMKNVDARGNIETVACSEKVSLAVRAALDATKA